MASAMAAFLTSPVEAVEALTIVVVTVRGMAAGRGLNWKIASLFAFKNAIGRNLDSPVHQITLPL